MLGLKLNHVSKRGPRWYIGGSCHGIWSWTIYESRCQQSWSHILGQSGEGTSALKYTNYNGVIMNAMTSQITSVLIVYSTVCSSAYQRKHQNSASLAFVRGIHRSPVNSPHRVPVTRKMLPFDDVVMYTIIKLSCCKLSSAGNKVHHDRNVAINVFKQIFVVILKLITATMIMNSRWIIAPAARRIRWKVFTFRNIILLAPSRSSLAASMEVLLPHCYIVWQSKANPT